MNRDDVKRILMSMRTTENGQRVDYILGKIDMMPEDELRSQIEQAGGTEEGVKEVFKRKVGVQSRESEEEVAINKFFTYKMTGDCIHLHLPHQLKEMMFKIGPNKTMNLVNAYLLDAMERVRQLKNDGFYKFKDKNSLYMISPILVKRELAFLDGMDFKTAFYTKGQLQDEEFVAATPEAQLGVHLFGNKATIGSAIISFDRLNTPEWQAKRKQKLEELKELGAVIDTDSVAKE